MRVSTTPLPKFFRWQGDFLCIVYKYCFCRVGEKWIYLFHIYSAKGAKTKREKSLSLARAFKEWMIMYLSLYNRYIYLFTYPIIICVTFCPILCDILSVETGQNWHWKRTKRYVEIGHVFSWSYQHTWKKERFYSFYEIITQKHLYKFQK